MGKDVTKCTYTDYKGDQIEVEWDTGERWMEKGCLELLVLLPFMGVITVSIKSSLVSRDHELT